MSAIANLSARDARLLDELAEAYITQSMMIKREHDANGSCEDREDDLTHELMHDAMRHISRSILELVPRLTDVPQIRFYLDTQHWDTAKC